MTVILTIGLTGGIACGKSSVSKIMARYGIKIINADDLAHQALERDSVGYKHVVNEFGESIIDKKNGQIDRKKLGAIVFADHHNRKQLENIIHPIVVKEIKEQIQHWRTQDLKILVVEVPLLFEAGLMDLFDQVWVVSASFEDQVQRLQMRDQLTTEEARMRIESQLPLVYKEEKADAVIRNCKGLADLEDQVRQLINSVE